MRYPEFENILTPVRMNRYLFACNGHSKKAMNLYRLNLALSQDFFSVIGCFEVALRNSVDNHFKMQIGNEWLLNGAMPGGIFDNEHCRINCGLISRAVADLQNAYTHDKLIAALNFGFWRYMFAPYQFNATGKSLLKIFPTRPASTPMTQFNHTYIFKRLRQINNLRNRIPHHEPICFRFGDHL